MIEQSEMFKVHVHEWGSVETPYAGTSGWSGSETSKDRAENADASGVTGQRQAQTLDLLDDANITGLTWKELSDATGWHHGTASGVLSVLHKTGHVARLSVSRDRCRVYVLPRHVIGRDVEQQGSTKRARLDEQTRTLLKDLLDCGLPEEMYKRVLVRLETDAEA